jgi:thymidylate synthase (FAD)
MIAEKSIGAHGKIALLEVMGSDETIARSARVSYGNFKSKTPEEDARLIRYLMRHEHMSPFEMCELIFYVKTTIYVWRQWTRHRTANINEKSLRYSKASFEFEVPQWRYSGGKNKQGSLNVLLEEEKAKALSEKYLEITNQCAKLYCEAVEAGAPKEQVRAILPVSLYTEAYWKIDLRNLLHFLRLRLDDTAQSEIRQYAEAIAEMVKERFPATWKAFEDYQLEAVRINRGEAEWIRKFLSGQKASMEGFSSGEIDEFRVKLEKLGITIPEINHETD